MVATKSPLCKLSWKVSETTPTKVGPMEQPRSPASANMANIAVPPFFIVFEARLKVPGQKIPTEKPHRAQPIKPNIAFEESAAMR